MRSVAILGAGVQGICAALALQAKGWNVSLVEQDPEAMLRASLRNEGKIHLGFTYAKDPSFRTSQLMLESGLTFAPLIDQWVPQSVDWAGLRSRPFTYLVMQDSDVDAISLFQHYERIDRVFHEIDQPWHHYLGTKPDHLWCQTDPLREVASEAVQATVKTAEAALNLAKFRRVLIQAIDESEHISCVFNHRVESVVRQSQGFSVGGTNGDGQSWQLHTDAVVNCLWENRLKFDNGLGIKPSRPWVYRLKYRVLGKLPKTLKDLPSLSLVLGSYGDIVPMPDASYISWYPACRRGWAEDLTVPQEWLQPCRGQVEAKTASEITSQTYRELNKIIPGIAATRTTAVDAGVIFSWGNTDIDHAKSELHNRHAIGITESDGYFSIDTGKLTCAPLFAAQLAARI